MPEEARRAICLTLGVPPVEVYRVASSHRTSGPISTGKYVTTVYNGTACHVRGAQLLPDQAASQLGIQPGNVTDDGMFCIECVNRPGACALGPIAYEMESSVTT